MSKDEKTSDLQNATSIRTMIALEDIHPDEQNRVVTKDDDWASFVDSIRVAGILQPLTLQHREDGSYLLIDGHRRLCGASEANLSQVPCDVWPANLLIRDTVVAGVILNEHRKAHGVLSLARRLRQLKNQFAESQESLAHRTGISLPRVKLYLGLFNASDFLLSFFDDADLTIAVAVQFCRFEKAAGEVEARRLVRRHKEAPLTAREVEILREKFLRKKAPEAGLDHDHSPETGAARRGSFAGRIAAAFRRDPSAARTELEEVLKSLGLKLAPVEFV